MAKYFWKIFSESQKSSYFDKQMSWKTIHVEMNEPWIQTNAFCQLERRSSERWTTELFWNGILQHQTFKELAKLAITCLITPVSNAVVESIFSLLSSIKTKPKTKMQLILLDVILIINVELLLSSKCCKDFTASPEMLNRTSYQTSYMLYDPLNPVALF